MFLILKNLLLKNNNYATNIYTKEAHFETFYLAILSHVDIAHPHVSF